MERGGHAAVGHTVMAHVSGRGVTRPVRGTESPSRLAGPTLMARWLCHVRKAWSCALELNAGPSSESETAIRTTATHANRMAPATSARNKCRGRWHRQPSTRFPDRPPEAGTAVGRTSPWYDAIRNDDSNRQLHRVKLSRGGQQGDGCGTVKVHFTTDREASAPNLGKFTMCCSSVRRGNYDVNEHLSHARSCRPTACCS